MTVIPDFKFTAGVQKHYFGLIYSWDYTHPEKSLADDRSIYASADYGLNLNGYLPSGLGELKRNNDKSFLRYSAGFNYHLVRREKGKPGLEFPFAWTRTQPKNSEIKPTDVLLAQMRFEWSTVVNKLEL